MVEYLDVDTSVALSPEILRLIENSCCEPGCESVIVYRIAAEKDYCNDHASTALGRELNRIYTEGMAIEGNMHE